MNRGDIVEVSWPFSDLSGTKVRPAVIVRSDFLNGIIDASCCTLQTVIQIDQRPLNDRLLIR